jgi:DNA-binding Lrp family transcriptional regulator
MTLMSNSRTSYRELAERLGLSINAVHKRIQAMVDEKIIRAFTARISLSALGAMTVIMLGQTEASSIEAVRDKLGANRSIYWLALAGGDQMVVGAYLHNLTELNGHINFVKSTCEMRSYFLGIMQSFGPDLAEDNQLYPLDYKIIYALHRNSRKTMGQVAEELEISAKTVRRRLDRLEAKWLTELSLEWYPDASNDIMTMFQIELKEGTDAIKAGSGLVSRYEPNVLFYIPFQNHPELILSFTWTPTMKELKDLKERLAKEPFVKRSVPNIIYSGFIFDTWRDDLLITKASQKVPSDRV